MGRRHNSKVPSLNDGLVMQLGILGASREASNTIGINDEFEPGSFVGSLLTTGIVDCH